MNGVDAEPEHGQSSLADVAGPGGATFIAGLGHSGSTLLSLLLSTHGDAIALGEIDLERLQRDPSQWGSVTCSCGSVLEHCPFWGQVGREVQQSPNADLDTLYQIVVRVFRRVFGPSAMLVDGSKNLHHLRSLIATGEPTRVIHLTRDVRSWSVSRLGRDERRGEATFKDLIAKYGVRGVGRLRRRSAFSNFQLWYRTTRLFERSLEALDQKVIRIGFEQLATAPARALGPVFEDLGLNKTGGWSVVPENAVAHVLFGNRTGRDPEELKAVTYDTAWLMSRHWLLASVVRRRVMEYNNRFVYSSGTRTASEALPADR